MARGFVITLTSRMNQWYFMSAVLSSLLRVTRYVHVRRRTALLWWGGLVDPDLVVYVWLAFGQGLELLGYLN